MGRTSCLLVLAAVLIFGGSALGQAPVYNAPEPGSAASLIVPGYAIGWLTLDKARSDLYYLIGTPNFSGSPMTSGVLGPQFRGGLIGEYWTTPPITAVYHPAELVIQALGAHDRPFATREKVGIGATETQVTTAYGDPSAVIELPSRPKVLIYDKQGIVFNVAFDVVAGNYGAVEGIYVFRPGTARNIWRTP